MGWIIEEKDFKKENIELLGTKYLLGNGYMGYRGTLEEFGKEQLCACTLSGLYDKSGNRWREPVNAVNPFKVVVKAEGETLSVLTKEPKSHVQRLDMKTGEFSRETVFLADAGEVTIKSERFLSRDQWNLAILRYTVCAQTPVKLEVDIKLDKDIWDINGPHLAGWEQERYGNIEFIRSKTIEAGKTVLAGQYVTCSYKDCRKEGTAWITEIPAEEIEFTVYAWISKEADTKEDIAGKLKQAGEKGYDRLLMDSRSHWDKIWKDANVVIEGDDAMDTALRYSIYQMVSSAPFHTDRTGIPARGLSGQVYKGAMFWDTEIFMLPFFTAVLPETAKNLVWYRIRMLEGAKRKAEDLGYEGAFYAWESQETGDEMCTKYGFEDVFTGRPLRTYFGDKQIHISADVAYGIWKYYQETGDEEMMLEGGLETITECIRFLYDYSVFKERKNRYELHDVTSPDEYHERNNNDAYTNILAKEMAVKMVELWEELGKRYPDRVTELSTKLFREGDFAGLKRFADQLYIPAPDENGIIEQFDGYFQLEEIPLQELLKRRLKDTEYLGGVNGIAASTQIIKQADVVLALMLLKNKYSKAVRKVNWEYYEPRTEHGSSLSSCIYALGAIDGGNEKKAYEYLSRTAFTDLNGDYKLYVGNLYIGGVHMAACGGTWMVIVNGFGGVSMEKDFLEIVPNLPEGWEKLQFHLYRKGQRVALSLQKDRVYAEAGSNNNEDMPIRVFGKEILLHPGESRSVER